MDLLSTETDDKIRAALMDAEIKGKLSVVAAVVGIAGGEDALRDIMYSKEALSIMDRGMLGLHLLCSPVPTPNNKRGQRSI